MPTLLNTCLILVRITYVVATQKNHLTEMVPLSTQKHMPNIGAEKHSNLRKSKAGIAQEFITISKLTLKHAARK